jgi:hypothetical protein
MFVPGGWMGNRADEYRRLADECLALFRLGGFSVQGRLNLLEMARIWNRLADEHDRAQPVLQQQQQVQSRPDKPMPPSPAKG